jgi:hypothetical protein
VVATFNATAREFGIVSSTNFLTHFGTGHQEDHPDVVFYRAGEGQKPLVIDVTVRHQAEHSEDAFTKARSVKMRKYQNWFQNEIEFQPFLMSSLAHMPKESEAIIRGLGKHALPGFTHAALRRVKCATIASSALRRSMLHAKNTHARSAASHATTLSLDTALTTATPLPPPPPLFSF